MERDDLPTVEEFREFAAEKAMEPDLVERTVKTLEFLKHSGVRPKFYTFDLLSADENELVSIHHCGGEDCHQPVFAVLHRNMEDIEKH